ncbi:MAG: hypothetical protein HYY02_10690, partial [Chloroflexi bacterium]|nr:hypothetical protein [Chloroflexota bacterium]
MTNAYRLGETQVGAASVWHEPPPVLFVFLGTTGRQVGLEPGRLYDDYRDSGAKTDLIVADTQLSSVAQVLAAEALPLPIPDIPQLRDRLDAHRELDYILRYTFPNPDFPNISYEYTSSADGTRSSPQEGCVAAAAAYPRLYDMLLNKVTQLGAYVPRPSTEPTRVTIVTVGFAGGGTFAGALPVFLVLT